MDTVILFQKFGLALGLGLLVGLQRERSASLLAGFRTFPLVTMLGTVLGVISAKDGWALSAAGLLGVAVLIAIGNWKKTLAGNSDPGMTTEAALLMMYGLGLFIASGPAGVAVVLGAAVASLLYLKPQLHGLARNIDENDFRGIMQFVAIALVILPMTPDLELGPYGMLNPRRIWWVVVLITGISLGGYLLYKTCPSGSGAITAGIFGGLISSTATTVSFARRTKTDATGTPGAALAIMLASTVVFARVLVLVAVAARAHLQEFGPPILVMLGVMLAVCGVMWMQVRGKGAELPEQTNPTELKTALVFTVLFTVVLIATAAARDYFGTRGLFAVAILSGLTDMDAITISTAQMAEKGHVASGIAWRVVLAAALSNIVFKTVTVASLGSRELLRRVVCGFGVAIAMGVVLLVVWP